MTWLMNGQDVTADDIRYNMSQTFSVQPDGKREDATSSLSFFPNKSDQGQQVTCRAVNAAMIDAKSASATLEVLCKFYCCRGGVLYCF